jgi:Reverse transcriptase (RNA-dependent DNA polymerase)
MQREPDLSIIVPPLEPDPEPVNVRRPDPDQTSDNNLTKIENHVVNFYEDLYKNNEGVACNENSIATFLGHVGQKPECQNSKLTEAESLDLDRPLTITELDKALKESNFKSAPGHDGINNKFIKRFWEALRVPLFKCSVNRFEKNELKEAFSTAKIKLIPKKGDLRNLTNWRPISLLNCFYKIISRAISNRLKKVMDKITNVGQKGYSKKRQCQEVLISLISGIKQAKKNNVKGLLISLDMKKAFDSLSHEYMGECLKFFGFGPYIIKWLTLLSTNRKACIQLGKNKLSRTFKLERGNAQGDVI